jgi:hypothetical protein
VHVVCLDREVHDAKGGTGGGREAAPQCREQTCAAQRGETAHDPQRDVNWLVAALDGASPMGHAGRRALRLPASARAATTPGPEGKRGLSGLVAHLD